MKVYIYRSRVTFEIIESPIKLSGLDDILKLTLLDVREEDEDYKFNKSGIGH